MSQTQFYEWCRRFKPGRTSIDDFFVNPTGNSHLLTSVTYKEYDYSSFTACNVAAKLNINACLCHMKNFNFGLLLLTLSQLCQQPKGNKTVSGHVKSCYPETMLRQFLKLVITGDEKWYDVETKVRSSQSEPSLPRSKNTLISIVHVKLITDAFFN